MSQLWIGLTAHLHRFFYLYTAIPTWDPAAAATPMMGILALRHLDQRLSPMWREHRVYWRSFCELSPVQVVFDTIVDSAFCKSRGWVVAV